MCGKYSIGLSSKVLQLELDLEMIHPQVTFPEAYYPTSAIPVVINAHRRNLEFFYWGFVPSWAKDIKIGRKMFNARAETLTEKPSYRNAFLRRRCLIPATGYFEWKSSENRKVPYYFSLRNEKAFFFAGLWEYWMDAAGNEVYSAAIITCPANAIVARYHDRMPVILGLDRCWKWMEDRPPADLQQLLVPYDPEQMIVTPVAKQADRLFEI